MNKGFTIQVTSHYDSNLGSDVNMKRSLQVGNILYNYLNSLNVNTKRLLVVGFGDFEPKKKCLSGVVCDEKLYAKNTRIEYRVINSMPSNFRYLGNGIWCKEKPQEETNGKIN